MCAEPLRGEGISLVPSRPVAAPRRLASARQRSFSTMIASGYGLFYHPGSSLAQMGFRIDFEER
jgi:hypothetical protein